MSKLSPEKTPFLMAGYKKSQGIPFLELWIPVLKAARANFCCSLT